MSQIIYNVYHYLYNWQGLNQSLFITINQITNKSILPEIFAIISSIFFITNFAIGYFIICGYFYLKIKRNNTHHTQTHNHIDNNSQALYFDHAYSIMTKTGLCYITFVLVFTILKFTINLPRPFCTPGCPFITIIDTTKERCLSSFPSAHTGLSILISYFLWPYIHYAWRICLCIVISMVAVSRIALAMHYPADIFFSILFTIISIILGQWLFRLMQPIIMRIGHLVSRLLF